MFISVYYGELLAASINGKSSHRVNQEAVQGGHCKTVRFRVEVRSHDLPSVVHLRDRGAFVRDHWPCNCLLLEIYLVLSVRAVTQVYCMEAVVVVPCQSRVSISRKRQTELIKDAAILKDIAKFSL